MVVRITLVEGRLGRVHESVVAELHVAEVAAALLADAVRDELVLAVPVVLDLLVVAAGLADGAGVRQVALLRRAVRRR